MLDKKTMELLIDNRESIKERLESEKQDMNITFENLSLGDYLFKLNGEDIIVIERKTIADYAASIRDGRHREQKARLLSNFAIHKIIYLVEGDITKNNSSYKYNKVSNETIVSSIVNTMLRDNIHVFHTKDTNETIFFLQTLYKKIAKQGKGFMKKTYSYEDTLCQTAVVKKNKNISKSVCHLMMFNNIPDVSLVTAKRLLNHFKTMAGCIGVLSELDENERLEFLRSIPVSEGKKFRKLSKKSCNNILDFLLD